MTLFQHVMSTLPTSIDARVEIMREVLQKLRLEPSERASLRAAMSDLDAHIVAVRESTLELDLAPRGSGRLGDKPIQRGSPRLGDKAIQKGSPR